MAEKALERRRFSSRNIGSRSRPRKGRTAGRGLNGPGAFALWSLRPTDGTRDGGVTPRLNDDDPISITIRNVRTSDAADIWRLVRRSGTLDVNSPYAYLLLCRHHADTCLVAEHEGRIVGFVTALRPPASPEVVFVWQIGVDDQYRQHRVGRRLLSGLIDCCPDARFLECTVAPDNAPSLALFRGLAARYGASLDISPGFAAEDFPLEAVHEREDLLRIGPLTQTLEEPPRPERSLST